jgi:DNA-binding IclR family transcriptional regulator
MRFQVEPRDVPPKDIARRMGMSLTDFRAALQSLIARGFPQPDLDTGNFDLSQSIDGATRDILIFLAALLRCRRVMPALLRRAG